MMGLEQERWDRVVNSDERDVMLYYHLLSNADFA